MCEVIFTLTYISQLFCNDLRTSEVSNRRLLKSHLRTHQVSQGLCKLEFQIEIPITLFSVTKYFIMEQIDFRINNVQYQIVKFPSLRNLNLSILTTPKLSVIDSGYVNNFKDSLFLDFIGFNYFYIELDVCDPKNFSLK